MVQGSRVHPTDAVATVISTVRAGDCIIFSDTETDADDVVTATEDIPQYHKVALMLIPKGGIVRKYGEVIGVATQEIQPGQWVHVHNLASPAPGKEG